MTLWRKRKFEPPFSEGIRFALRAHYRRNEAGRPPHEHS